MRIAVTGPESSGKSTLCEALAKIYTGVSIPEYAREYLLERGGIYFQRDLDVIATGQVKSWENNSSTEFTFFDTEMLVMKIWSNYKYGACSELIMNHLNEQRFDHYFVCRPDIPWEYDPLRENSSNRDELFEIYLKELKNHRFNFTIVEGDVDNRLKTCKEVIQKLSLPHL
jgi:NadR type nicotinamide-nucleotide adenylyltransferase